MAFDGLMTTRVVGELQTLVGGRINKIHQPYTLDLTMSVRSERKNVTLLASANAMYARLHLTEETTNNPSEPPMFCMMLRKHLEGGFIESIEQLGRDRIVLFRIRSRNELGDEEAKKLYIELMGRHSNIILTDGQDRILDAIKHLPLSQNTYRTIMPGMTYQLPPQPDKVDPLTGDIDQALSRIDWNAGKIDRQLLGIFSGISPQVAEEVVHRAKLANRTSIKQSLSEVLDELSGPYQLQRLANGKERFAPVRLTSEDVTESREYATSGKLLDAFFHEKANRDRVKQQAADLERFIKSEYEKNKLKHTKLMRDLEATEKADELRHKGELLTTYSYQLTRGMKEASVVDYYDEDGGEITIQLDPRFSPNENAQRYYKRYNKLKTAKIEVAKQIEKNEAEIQYFETLLSQLDVASPKDIQEMRDELVEGGYLRERSKKKKKPTTPVLEAYVSSTGIPFSVGKNNKQNDFATFKFARRSDTWLHTKDIPGSHVIIQHDAPDETTLLEAATVAAYFSKARSSSQVPVDFTEARYVKKPSGAKPGFVIYTDQTTVYVKPDADLVQRLKKD
ncbi:Rqc2 family fibronectin-binding protein [Exiguobacterium flavidum]|uniref:Rqc2 family fibronectin-binding protein n=1 Tax=Exiguobacterium flavidum TaxID=2184695 RepID=UPI000DF81A3F|nr:NFACT family protein [Exiguobacterium flavidum]